MREKRIENSMTTTIEKPTVERAIMQLVVDSYLHGAQTCELHDGKVLGVSINQGNSDNIHLFINDHHITTVEVQNGLSRITVMNTREMDDISYIIPFVKSLGLSESRALQCFMEM